MDSSTMTDKVRINLLLRKCRSIRRAAGVSQDRLAKVVGVSRGKIKRLEGGELREIDRQEQRKISRALAQLHKDARKSGSLKKEASPASRRKSRNANLKKKVAERRARREKAREVRKVLEKAGLLDVTLGELLPTKVRVPARSS